MRTFLAVLGRAAGHDAPVLLVGETGSGKTAFARVLHELSARASGPFVRVDCPAGPRQLAAHAESARGGTFFLDEVTALSSAAQVAALRLLQDAPPPPLQLGTRIVASAHHDLESNMADGSFRRDLFYRLAVVEVRIPPLRQRREDILPIAQAFLASLTCRAGRAPPEISADLQSALVAYSWPGNVAELLAVLERALIVSGGRSLDVDALPERMRR
jgi:two-component system, NtrC family, response regulator HydG